MGLVEQFEHFAVCVDLQYIERKNEDLTFKNVNSETDM